ncbi:MAG: hypothetical protein AB1756_06915 [Acidobacteriota bacterium]
MKEKIRAVGLISGGLDSTLAAMVMKDAGVDVYGVNFSTGFCIVDHRRAVRRKKDSDPKKLRNEALRAASDVEIPIEIIDISKEFLEIVLQPKHGYGSNINPCIDCRIFMLKKAKEHADRIGAKFVFTGEVLGQRPMSQHRSALMLIENQSGLEGYIVRPLSAKLLEPTVPEKEGWVERDKLYSINGRSRKEQFELCKRFGLEDFPQPSGGCCYLTDPNYARRFRDMIAHREKGKVTCDDLILLKVGRHFRLSYRLKAIIGRDEQENRFLERYRKGRLCFEALNCGSPLTIVEGEADAGERRVLAALTARYSSARGQETIDVRCMKDGLEEVITITAAEIKDFSESKL